MSTTKNSSHLIRPKLSVSFYNASISSSVGIATGYWLVERDWGAGIAQSV
jgi:hypothetical protein